MEVEKSKRYRINLKETAKREKYWEFTVDMEGFSMEEVLAESDALVAALDRRYPAPMDK